MIPREKIASLAHILDSVCQLINQDLESLQSATRTKELSEARQFLTAFLIKRGFTHSKIGGLLKRDRTTIMHLIRAFNNLMEYDLEMRKNYLDFEDKAHRIWSSTFYRPMRIYKKEDAEL